MSNKLSPYFREFWPVTPEDRARGWKEIRVSFVDENPRMVRLNVPPPSFEREAMLALGNEDALEQIVGLAISHCLKPGPGQALLPMTMEDIHQLTHESALLFTSIASVLTFGDQVAAQFDPLLEYYSEVQRTTSRIQPHKAP